MAFSMEDNIYIALYGCWKDAANTPLLENWAKDRVSEMEHLATGIQLADEGLHRRTARFVRDENLERLDAIRATQDPDNQFNAWHSRPSSTAVLPEREGGYMVYAT
jgi:hypothetical protein